MTVGNIPVINVWTGNGVNKNFDFDFRINKSSELKVYLESAPETILELGVDYKIKNITDNGGDYPLEGGTIEFPLSGSSYEVLTSEEKIVLILNLPFTQEKSFTQGGITGTAVEECLDDNVRMMQLLKQNVANIESSVETTISDYKTEIDGAIDDIETDIADFKNQVADDFDNFKDEVEEMVEEVSEAAEKINQLEEAVNTAVQAAEDAEESAGIASAAASLVSSIGDVADLTTTAKDTIVAAVNELNSNCEKIANKGQPNGYCPLDANAKIDETYLPKIDSGMTKFAINKGNPNLMYTQGSGTVEQPFSVTTMSSDGTIGGDSFAVSGTYYSTYYGYQGFAPQTTGCCIQGSLGTTYFEMYNPNPIKDLTVTMTNFVLGSYYYPLDQYQIKYSNDGSTWVDGETGRNTTTYTGTFSISILGGYKYIRIYPTNFYRSNSVCWKNMTISGTEVLSVSTADTLYFNVDNNNPLTYTNIMGETRTVNALSPIDVSAENDGTYKVALPQSGNQPYLFDGYIYIGEEFKKQFTQPTLTANGTMGVDYFACAATNYYSSNYPYLAFDKNPTTYYASSLSSGNFEFGCLEALNIKKLTITNRPDYTTSYLASGTVYGSNDYNTWDELTTFTNSVSAMSANWDINLSSNTNYYKYYRLSCVGSDTNFAIADIKISASREIKTGDVWINPQEPNSAQQWNNADWQDFNDIILQDSSVTVSSGVITAIKQPTYNYNGINLNQTSKTDREFISRMSSPSNTKINYTIGASDSKYESPADGEWSIFGVGAINGGCYIAFSNLNNGDVNMISTGGAGYGIFTKIKVKKGDVLMLQYANVTFQYMHFISNVGGDN